MKKFAVLSLIVLIAVFGFGQTYDGWHNRTFEVSGIADIDTAKINVLNENLDADQKMISDLGTLKTDSVTSNSGDLVLRGAGTGGVDVDSLNGLLVTTGTNTFNLARGTGSLDVAAGVSVDIDKNLTINGQATTITGAGQANTVTLNESFTVGDGQNVTITAEDAAGSITLDEQTFEVEGEGTASQLFKLKNAENAARTLTFYEDLTVGNGNSGTLTYSAASKTATVEDNVTIGLDVNALEGLSGTGLVARTAANTYSERTVTGTAQQVTVTNGNGVSGNPTISLPANVSITGIVKTGKIDVKNQTALESTIGTDSTRIYTYDDGSQVHIMATKDDNATETVSRILEKKDLKYIPHTGKRERYAGNNGLGQSYPAYVKYAQSDAIAGTRTSDYVFTRTEGTWVVDALIGQYCFSYVAASPNTGTWLPITDNDATTLTVSGTLQASADAVKTCIWNPIAATYAHGQGTSAFYGGVFDGESIWLVPYNSSNLVKVNPATGAMTNYAHGQGNGAYAGGVFDGESIWLVPYSSANLVKVNPATGAMTTYAHGQGATAFRGGVFDGESIWLVPFSSANLVKVNPATGAMTTYAHGQGTSAFTGGVFDGESIWLVPYSANLVKVNPATGAMTNYAHGQGNGAFTGGVFDGESIWLVPFSSANLVKVNPATGAMTTYAHGQGETAFYGGVFDGESIWLVHNGSANLVKVNPATGAMTTYAHGQEATAFRGGVFDGESIWLVPFSSANLVKVNPPYFGREVLPAIGGVTTNVFTTDIASGTANKDLTVPQNCTVQAVTLINTLTAGDITNFQAILDPAGDNITLFSGKTITNGKTLTITALADHPFNTTTKTLRFNATGNGAGGIEILVDYARRR